MLKRCHGEILLIFVSFNIIAGEIKEITDQLYYTQKDDLYFVAQKIVVPSQFVAWQLMVEFNQGAWYSELQARNPERSALAAGVSNAAGSLLTPLCDYENMEAWVLYVTTKEPNMNGFDIWGAEDLRKGLLHGEKTGRFEEYMQKFLKKASRIVMVMGLSTSEDAPFQNHQGIFRNLKYILEGKKEYPGLAIALHAFAAKWSLMVLKNKKYALVAPMPAMEKILVSNLSEGAYYKGRNNQIIQISGKINSLPASTGSFYCVKYQIMPDFKFKLFDKQGKQLISLTNSSLNGHYHWALSKLYMSQGYPLFTLDLEELAKKAP